MDSEASPRDRRIEVTVIGGYLGSGKTTLVNHILTEATERIVVLVNDFGDINIDAELIASRSDDTIELANGCICCSIVDGFTAALDKVTAISPRPDRLVIEASGVSDPAMVAAYAHGPGLALDAVVVLVDAETVRDRVNDRYVGQTVTQQLASAHVIVANKCDLVSSDKRDDLVDWVRERWPDAFVTTANHSRVRPEILLGKSFFAEKGWPGKDQKKDAGERRRLSAEEISDVFETWSIEENQPTTREAIAAMMDDLPDSVVRAKGFVWLEESPDSPAVLQRVGRRWTLRAMTPKGTPWAATPRTQIVCIATTTGGKPPK